VGSKERVTKREKVSREVRISHKKARDQKYEFFTGQFPYNPDRREETWVNG
jgi:hypothetical protein